MRLLLSWVLLLVAPFAFGANGSANSAGEAGMSENAGNGKTVFVLPIRADIMPPLVYLVRRGVKEAMEAKADCLVLDMDTNGGRVDTTEEIIEILGKFTGRTATYVNRKAFSAGAFISVATKQIFMAPQSVIGAAAPIMMMPGAGVEKLPETVEAKMTSGIKALVRTTAKKNGHNPEVIEAMIDRTKELKMGDKVLNRAGQILTLDDEEAATLYGDPPKPLLSAGTVESLEGVLVRLQLKNAKITRIEPTGAERLASWINAISPILLIVGAAGLYMEFKTPGFGVPGIVGLTSFALYFFGNYIAGLAGLEWVIFFVIGVAMVALELFVFPGTVILGVGGAFLMALSVLMAMVDFYPGMPAIPSMDQLRLPLRELMIAAAGAGGLIFALSLILPKTQFYQLLCSTAAVRGESAMSPEREQSRQIGRKGIALCALRPGGKGRFGQDTFDVLTQGEMIEKGLEIRIVGYSGGVARVESCGGGIG